MLEFFIISVVAKKSLGDSFLDFNATCCDQDIQVAYSSSAVLVGYKFLCHGVLSSCRLRCGWIQKLKPCLENVENNACCDFS